MEICRSGLHDKTVTGKYRDGACRACRKQKGKRDYKNNKEIILASQKDLHKRRLKDNPDYWKHRGLMARYAMTQEDYEKWFHKQNGQCALCYKPPKQGQRLHIDHCHKTGIVRGLLCLTCNAGIGQMDDNPELLKRAAEYIIAALADAKIEQGLQDEGRVTIEIV